jgi:hypothetical protein
MATSWHEVNMTAEPYIIIGLYWLFSAIVGGMPDPLPASRTAYRWAYGSLHILAGNISLAVQSKYKPILGIDQSSDNVITHQESTTVLVSKPVQP